MYMLAAALLQPAALHLVGVVLLVQICCGAGTLTHRDAPSWQHPLGGQVPRAAGACPCSRLGALLGSARLATSCLTLGTTCMRHCSRLGPLLGRWGPGAPLPLHRSHKHVLSGVDL